MNDEKLNYNLGKLEKKFPDKVFINKGKMLKVVDKSYSTSKRRSDSNTKTDIPDPTDITPYNRKGNPTNGYQYDLFDLAVFLTDRNYYWKMIEERNNKDEKEKSRR